MEDGSVARRRRAVILLQVVTLTRIPVGLLFASILLLTERTLTTFSVCFALLCVAEISDLADGFIARRFGLVTEWGAMLDPYADSVSRLIVYWACANAGLVMSVVPLVMAVRDVTVAYCRVVLTRRGQTVSANFSGKLKATVQGVASGLAILQPFYWDYARDHGQHSGIWTYHVISWSVIVITALSAVQYVKTAAAASRSATIEK